MRSTAETEWRQTQARLSDPGPWLVLLGLWTVLPLVIATFTGLAMQQGLELPRPRELVHILAVWLPWLPLSRGIAELRHWFPIRGRRAVKHASIHLFASWAAALIVGACTTWITWLIPPWPRPPLATEATLPPAALTGDVFRVFEGVGAISQILYWSILGASSALAWYQRSRQQAGLLAEARLQALTAQIRPHFLFNTLHTIADLMEDDVPAAREMIARLGDLLRHSLEGSSALEVRLEAELELVRTYLDIEQVRFGDRLRVHVNVTPEARRAWVPHLLLQPLVENAIGHGISRETSAGDLRIEASTHRGVLTLKVHDDGPGPGGTGPHPADPGQQTGIGLGNVRARIAELYGPDGKLELLPRQPRGATALVELPLRMKPAQETP